MFGQAGAFFTPVASSKYTSNPTITWPSGVFLRDWCLVVDGADAGLPAAKDSMDTEEHTALEYVQKQAEFPPQLDR